MGPKKKAKGETPEEKAARELEEQKQRDLEAKLAAEEQKRKEIEAEKLKAHLKAVREEEFNRLQSEIIARDDKIEECKERLDRKMAILKEETEWTKFREAIDETDPASEKELNTFVSLCREAPIESFNDALELVRKIEEVSKAVKTRWAECMARNNSQGQTQCLHYLIDFSNCIIEAIDKGTAIKLRTTSINPDALEKGQDLYVEEVATDVMVGMWTNLDGRINYPGNRKQAVFPTIGWQVDIPKLVLAVQTPLKEQIKFVYRIVRMPLETFNLQPYEESSPGLTPQKLALISNTKVVVGDLYIYEMLAAQKDSFKIASRNWILKDNSEASKRITRKEYPVNAVTKCYITLPQTVVFNINDVRVNRWDEEKNEFTEDGIENYEYLEEKRQITFCIKELGTFALVKDRVVDFPYKRWTISPHRDLSAAVAFDQFAKLFVQVGTVDITIAIAGPKCYLMKSNSKALIDLLNVPMLPGILLSLLQSRGVNLVPTKMDAARTEGLLIKKNSAVEARIIEEVSTTVNTLEYSSNKWNQLLTSEDQFGLYVRESTLFTAREESFDYECVLAEEDAGSQSVKDAPDVGVLSSIRNPGANVKYLLVMGNEYGDKKTYDLRPRPEEVTHMTIAASMSNRITPEAKQRLVRQDEQFTNVVYRLLQLVQPFAFQ